MSFSDILIVFKYTSAWKENKTRTSQVNTAFKVPKTHSLNNILSKEFLSVIGLSLGVSEIGKVPFELEKIFSF